jgi:hypothetical protein
LRHPIPSCEAASFGTIENETKSWGWFEGGCSLTSRFFVEKRQQPSGVAKHILVEGLGFLVAGCGCRAPTPGSGTPKEGPRA